MNITKKAGNLCVVINTKQGNRHKEKAKGQAQKGERQLSHAEHAQGGEEFLKSHVGVDASFITPTL